MFLQREQQSVCRTCRGRQNDTAVCRFVGQARIITRYKTKKILFFLGSFENYAYLCSRKLKTVDLRDWEANHLQSIFSRKKY